MVCIGSTETAGSSAPQTGAVLRYPKAGPPPMSWQHTRGKLAAASRKNPGSPEVDELRRQFQTERLEERIREVVDQAPPLKPEQIRVLRKALHPAANDE